MIHIIFILIKSFRDSLDLTVWRFNVLLRICIMFLLSSIQVFRHSSRIARPNGSAGWMDCQDIFCPPRMKPDDFADSLTFPLVPA